MSTPQFSSDSALGIDGAAVEHWFAVTVPNAVLPLSFELIAGGRSNLTYRVIDSRAHSWVLRRPPAGPLNPGAHNMEREWRILTALQSSAVPVPPTVAFCADPAVTGADFYVMDHVEGIVIDSAKRAAALTQSARSRLGDQVTRTLAAIHHIDPGVVGRRGDARANSYISRQLDLWLRQVSSACIASTPEIIDVHGRLSESEPPQQWTTLTHGDFRLGNMLVTPAGAIEAVLDWELWTVGDPLADIGWLAAWWNLDEDDGWAPSRAEGFPTIAELAAQYQQLTGRDTSDLPYYMSFALWRLACIAQGVYERYSAAMMGKPPAPLDVLATRPRELALAARAALN